MSERDPRVNPMKGDMIEKLTPKGVLRARVTRISPSPTHVWSSVQYSDGTWPMDFPRSIASWRTWAKGATVIHRAES